LITDRKRYFDTFSVSELWQMRHMSNLYIFPLILPRNIISNNALAPMLIIIVRVSLYLHVSSPDSVCCLYALHRGDEKAI
jgi:hypothetical protein